MNYRERREAGHYAAPQTEATEAEALPDEAPSEAEAAEEPTEAADELEGMTKSQLIELARERGISPANAAMSKDELLDALTT